MVSITEQGFIRRNWGKLALGGGALALAGMHGAELSKDALSGAVKSGTDASGEAVKKAREAITNAVKNPKETLQKGAEAAGAATRKAVDVSKDIGGSAVKGYKGTGEAPNVPAVKPQSDIAPMRLSPSHSQAAGVTGAGVRPESVGRAEAYKSIGDAPKIPNVPGVAPQDTSAVRVKRAIGVSKVRDVAGTGIDKARSAIKANSERVEDIANDRRLQRAKEIGRLKTRLGEPVPNQYGT